MTKEMNPCPKPVKSKSCRLCPKPRYGLSRLCRSHWLEKAREKKEASRLKKLDRKLNSKSHQQSELKKWKARCWKLMSEWVRRSGADFQGFTWCFTCRKPFQWKELDCSHRHHGKLDLDERNLRPCCTKCNRFLHGNLGEYERRLIEENGLEWAQKLAYDAAQHKGYTNIDELKRIHADLQEKLKKLSQ